MYSPTVEDIVKPYLQYPKTIQQAILLVETNPRFIGLTRSMKSVLKALLTRASQANGTTQIKARLDTVAMQADVSTKTVERTMKILRDAGWIATVTEGRSAWGVFESKRYQFTEALCELIGLPTGKAPGWDSASTVPAPGNTSAETKMSDGAIYVDLNFKKDYRKILEKKRKANPEANPITLPDTLQPIVDLGVKPSGVCKLRGMASDQGYKLEDIFTVARKYLNLKKASAGRVYRYLETLINKPSDYAARAAQLVRIDSNPAGSPAAAKPKHRSAKYAYKRYIVGAGKIVKIFDGMAEVTRDGQYLLTIAERDMEKVYDDIESGKLKEIVE